LKKEECSLGKQEYRKRTAMGGRITELFERRMLRRDPPQSISRWALAHGLWHQSCAYCPLTENQAVTKHKAARFLLPVFLFSL
jgi:hypothetical protein